MDPSFSPTRMYSMYCMLEMVNFWIKTLDQLSVSLTTLTHSQPGHWERRQTNVLPVRLQCDTQLTVQYVHQRLHFSVPVQLCIGYTYRCRLHNCDDEITPALDFLRVRSDPDVHQARRPSSSFIPSAFPSAEEFVRSKPVELPVCLPSDGFPVRS